MPVKKIEEDHPAYGIPDSYVKDLLSENEVDQLLKLPGYLPCETGESNNELMKVRSNWRFSYVFNWIYLFKSYINISSNVCFNISVFEEELVDYTVGSRVNNFMNLFKIGIINRLPILKFISKIKEADEFDYYVYMYLFNHGVKKEEGEKEKKEKLSENLIKNADNIGVTHLYFDDVETKDKEKEKISKIFDIDDQEIIDKNYLNILFKKYEIGTETIDKTSKFFHFFSIEEKINVYYLLIEKACENDSFKKYVDNLNEDGGFDTGMNCSSWYTPIFSKIVHRNSTSISEESFFYSNENRIYKKTITFKKNQKKQKKLNNFKWKCLNYSFYDLIKEVGTIYKIIGKSKNNKKTIELVDDIFHVIVSKDIEMKKNYKYRLREKKIHELIVNRKRSSRIQEREARLKVEIEKNEKENGDNTSRRYYKRLRLMNN